jgi:hypothetical protein
MTPVIGDIIQTVGNLAGELITTEKEVRQLDIDSYKAETERLVSQTEINKEEAKSASTWVSGARPFIMWVCGVAFAYAAVIEPVMRFISSVAFGYTGAFPTIDTDITMQVLLGILGLGVMRSAEKFKNVAAK